MAKVYISLGTNLGDKEQNLRTAVQKIEEQVGKVIPLSAFYITAPWGFDSEHSFLNAAACMETELSPLEVLQKTQEIERELGRTHKSVGGVLIVMKQRKGLHSKKSDNGIFIYAYSKKV